MTDPSVHHADPNTFSTSPTAVADPVVDPARTPVGAPAPNDARRPPDRWVLPAVLLAAAGTDLAMWTTGPGLAWSIGATAVAIAVAIGARPTNRPAQLLLAAVPLLAIWCTVRTTPWLIAPDVIAVNACLLLSVAVAHGGRWFDQTLLRLTLRLAVFVEDLVMAPDWWVPPLRQRSGRSARSSAERRATWLGIVIALPIVVILIALLASADVVFASFFDLGLAPDVVARHVVFLLGGAWVMSALLRRASSDTDDSLGSPSTDALRASAGTGNIVLAGTGAVFGLYAVSRLLSLTGTAEHIATTRGLTWAEYARTGFFQLLAVAAITLVVMVAVIGWCAPGTERQAARRRLLGLANAALIVGIVIDAIHRLAGYQDAYGLTMLRLYSSAFAVWIGIVFVLVAVAYRQGYRGRRWLAPAILCTALVSLLGMNIADPEAIVADRNLSGPTKAGETDLGYLGSSLSDDAVGTVARRLPAMTAEDQRIYVENLCWERPAEREWFNPNAAAADAHRVRAEWCERLGS